MKRTFIQMLGLSALLALTVACGDDETKPSPKPEAEPFDVVASTDFGITAERLAASETAAGRTAGAYDTATRTLEVATGNADFPNVTYYFDEADAYRYALVEAASFDLLSYAATGERLEKGNWRAYSQPAMLQAVLQAPSAAQSLRRNLSGPGALQEPSALESIYSNGKTLLCLFHSGNEAQTTPAMLVGPVDESTFSWTRTTSIEDAETGLSIPLTALGCPLDLVRKYELRLGHTINSERTNPSKQFYAFDTGDARYPMMGYWFDVETDTFLEECALYVSPESRPTPAQADTYAKYLGFDPTPLRDENGNYLYYHEGNRIVCLIEMNEPETGVFSPKLRFYRQDLTDLLPKSSVVIPWPNMEFGKITMAEAETWYRAKGYTIGMNAELELPQVTTDSEDFPTILLLEDAGKYYGALLMTPDAKVIHSLDIERQLLEEGFVYVEGSILPTYRNAETNIEAQIDASAMFGAYSIGFNLIGA